MKVQCKECSKDFNTYHKGRFCTMECYQRNRWGTHSICKQCGELSAGKKFCNKKCQRDFWNKNDYQLIKKKRIWQRKIEIILELGGKCVTCGLSDIRVLDINHIDRGKKKRPPKREYNWARRLKEWKENIDNLELMCSNCHRIHTWEQMGYGEGLDETYFNIAKQRIGDN